MLGLAGIDDHRADRTRPGQQRQRQRHHRNAGLYLGLVLFFRRGLGAAGLRIQHVHGHHDHDEPAAHLQRCHRDIEELDDLLAQQRGHRHHDRHRDRRDLDGTQLFRFGLLAGQADEERDRPDRVDQRQQRDKRLERIHRLRLPASLAVLAREVGGRRNQPARLRFQEAQSVPLVDGIVLAARGSSSTAMRSARPKALNTVSHW